MNIADVLNKLVGDAKWGPDTVEDTYGRLEAFNAVDAWVGTLERLAEGIIPDRPVGVSSAPAAVGGVIDYDKLAAAIVKAQTAQAAHEASAPEAAAAGAPPPTEVAAYQNPVTGNTPEASTAHAEPAPAAAAFPVGQVAPDAGEHA